VRDSHSWLFGTASVDLLLPQSTQYAVQHCGSECQDHMLAAEKIMRHITLPQIFI